MKTKIPFSIAVVICVLVFKFDKIPSIILNERRHFKYFFCCCYKLVHLFKAISGVRIKKILLIVFTFWVCRLHWPTWIVNQKRVVRENFPDTNILALFKLKLLRIRFSFPAFLHKMMQDAANWTYFQLSFIIFVELNFNYICSIE